MHLFLALNHFCFAVWILLLPPLTDSHRYHHTPFPAPLLPPGGHLWESNVMTFNLRHGSQRPCDSRGACCGGGGGGRPCEKFTRRQSGERRWGEFLPEFRVVEVTEEERRGGGAERSQRRSDVSSGAASSSCPTAAPEWRDGTGGDCHVAQAEAWAVSTAQQKGQTTTLSSRRTSWKRSPLSSGMISWICGARIRGR